MVQRKEVKADDNLVYEEGDTDSEAEQNHDERIIALLERAQETGMKFNTEKFRYRLKEVPYIGYKLTSQGLVMAEEKVKAINQMPTSIDVN